jgi:hypothetical protein
MKKINLIALIFMALFIGCTSDDENPVSPEVPEEIPISNENAIYQELILGKWELIASGHTEEEIQSVTPDGSYTEYFSNGKIKYYYGTSERTEEEDCIYELDAEFLYKYFNREIYGTESDQIYKYNFNSNKDELTLEIIQGMIPDIANFPFIKVYKRIK